MKRNYILWSAVTATALLAVSQTFLSPDKIEIDQLPDLKAVSINNFPTHPAASETELSEGWTVINNNGDLDSYDEEITWRPVNDDTYRINAVKTGYTPNNGGPMDDYLLSPAVELEGGNQYTISFSYRIGGYYDSDNLAVYVSTSTNPEEIKASEPLFKRENAYEASYVTDSFNFTPAATDNYHIVFYCYSDAFKSGVWISEVNILGKVAPNPVSNLTAVAATDNSISCTLNWELPTTNVLGAELSGENAIEKVLVYRDEEETPVELPADAVSYTDTEEKGLTAGSHSYSVSVVAAGSESEKTTVEVHRVGPAQAIVIPAAITFNSEADFEDWTVTKGEGSTTSQSWRYNDVKNFASFEIGYWQTDNDWLITPPVKVEEEGYFQVNLLGVMTTGSEGKFTILKGTSADVESMEAISPVFSLPEGNEWTTEFPETGCDVYLTPGIYHFALHNKLGKNNPNMRPTFSYYVKGFNIAASSYRPGSVTNLTAKGAEDMSCNLIVSWNNPATDMAGQSMEGKDFKVKIYLNDEETEAATVEDGSETCTIAVPSEGLYNVSAIVESADGEAKSDIVSVKSSWVGAPTVAIPYETNFDKTADSAVEIWESFAIDGNHDGKAFYHGSNPSGSFFTIEGGTGEYKDFILSPYLNLSAGSYQISYTLAGGASYNVIPVVVGYVKAGSFNADNYESEMTVLLEKNLDDYGNFNESSSFTIEEEGMYQIVFGEVGTRTSDFGELQLLHFDVKELLPYPANVTQLKVTPDSENEEAAVISWKNPSTIYGTDKALTEIESIIIERDEEVVATLTEGVRPGEESSFTDLLPSGGYYRYTVYATYNGQGHGEVYASVLSPWIGGGIAAPLNMDADDERWTIIDTHNDLTDKGWYSSNGWYNSNGFLCYVHDSTSKPADDYIIAPPVKIKEGELYKVTFEATPHGMAPQKNYTASVKMGPGSDHTLLPEVATVDIPEDASNNDPKEYSFYVAVGQQDAPAEAPVKAKARSQVEGDAEEVVDLDDERYLSAVKLPAGSHTVALHAATNGGGLRVAAFRFEKAADIDLPTGIEKIASDELSIKDGVIYFAGIEDVKIYDLTGVCLMAADNCEGSFTIPQLKAGYYIITVGEKVFKMILK